ncbi:MAG: hypothetical protein WC471_04090 [Candidatus Woesearchaeota archaeon]
MEKDEEYDSNIEDIANTADDKIDALVNLLVKKKLITEEEFQKAYDELFDDDEEDEVEEE